MTKLSVAIIIPALNEAKVIDASIRRAWDSGCDEVIVVDGGSEDDTVSISEKMECRVIHSERGRGNQLNAGSAAANSDVLLFMHADNWLAKDGCQQICQQMENDQHLEYGGFLQSILNDHWMYRWIEYGNAQRVYWRGLLYGDQGLFVRRRLFERTGGFPNIPIMEDLEFSRVLKKIGRAKLLTGPIYVDARRWTQHGLIRQTLRNWYLSSAYLCGASPNWLAGKYRNHDLDGS
ncbi:MAG: TIGR04283 family arsenosugar biosynthesis glycosyltransferase [Planctomycetota bacterium]